MASATPDPQPTNPAPPTDEKSSTETLTPTPTPAQTTQSPPLPTQSAPEQATANDDDDDDDSDFDELDEVLDNFKPKAPSVPAPNPDTTSAASAPAPAAPTTTTANPQDAFDEEAFMRQLEKDMASMMGQAGQGSGDNAGFESTIDQGADAFTKQLEESGIPPGDFLKQLLADVMAEGGGGDVGAAAEASSSPAPQAAPSGDAPPPESFNDAIQATINRMKESGDKATAAAEEDDLSGDLVAQLLKAVEAGAGSGDEGDLTKMFMGMMEQLSNKEMLYEPMKELDTKFQPWIVEHRGSDKVSAEEMTRYETQASIVSQIVTKFEEPGYTDEDPKCREYVWEKMQAMQAAGNPPEELVANPWMDDLKGPGAGAGAGPGGMPDCPQQ